MGNQYNNMGYLWATRGLSTDYPWGPHVIFMVNAWDGHGMP